MARIGLQRHRKQTNKDALDGPPDGASIVGHRTGVEPISSPLRQTPSLLVRTPSCIETRDWLAQRMYWPGPLNVSRGLNEQYRILFQDSDVPPPGQKPVLKAVETLCLQ